MKLARIVSIIMLLLQRTKVTAVELSEMFEVTTRTIFRDVDTINEAGIPIVTYTGVNGGISIMDGYKIEKGLFSTADIVSLLIGLSNMPISDDDVINAMAKIKGLVSTDQLQAIEEKAQKITIDYTTWRGNNTFTPYFSDIKKAVDSNNLMSFGYYDENGKEVERTAEPHRMFFKDSIWYLQAYCIEQQDFRTFRLSRMSYLKVSTHTFAPREPKPLGKDTANLDWINVKLLVDMSIKPWMMDFCGAENIEPYDDSKVVVNMPFMASEYGFSVLLRFGDKCEVLEPEVIRQEVIERANRLLNIYQR